MNKTDLVRRQSEESFRYLLETLEGVDEPHSWSVVPMKEGEYLHSNGSILTIVQHVASCKRMYASAGFRNGELTWRACAEIYDEVGPSWERTIQDLRDAHQYWMGCLEALPGDRFEETVFRPQGDQWPIWRIVSMMVYHDAYHGGQIEVLKASLGPSSTPPPSTGDDIREHCRDGPFW